MKPRVAIYARVSTPQQHTDNQVRELNAWAERMHWQVVEIYVDHESGARSERASLRCAMAAAAARKFDRLLVWSLSRLTREGVAATFQYVQRLKAAGVELWSYTEEHFRTAGPAGDLFLSIAAYIADQERIQHVQRVRAGLARAQAAGQQLGRPRRPIDIQRILSMRETFSVRQIAAETGLSKSTIQRLLKNHNPRS